MLYVPKSKRTEPFASSFFFSLSSFSLRIHELINFILEGIYYPILVTSFSRDLRRA